MIFLVNLPRFLKKYFPVSIGAFFLALFSLVSAETLMSVTYFHGAGWRARSGYSFQMLIVLGFVIFQCNFMMMRGRSGWVSPVVGLLIACILCSAPTIIFSPPIVLYLESIALPLFGLLLLNSKRHREMRRKLIQVRRHRELILKALEMQRKRG